MCLNQKSYVWNHPLPSKPKIWKLYGACQNKIEHWASYSICKSHGYVVWLGQWFSAFFWKVQLVLQGSRACGKSGSFGSLCKRSVMQALMFAQNEVFTPVPVQWHSPKTEFSFMNNKVTCQQSLLTLQRNRQLSSCCRIESIKFLFFLHKVNGSLLQQFWSNVSLGTS